MRRIIPLALVLIFLLALCPSASAAVSASQVTVSAIVGQDESCQVTVDVTLYLDHTVSNLRFPVPLEATDIYLGTSRVWTQRTAEAQFIDLSGLYGSQFRVSYTLPDVIGTGADGEPLLTLPLLSGFEYPISKLDFSVTLPGEVPDMPAFSSGYHQASIEKELSYARNGAAFTGSSLTELKDHETLTMTLRVSKDLFPNARLELFDSDTDDTAMIICGILALLYWLIFLRALPPRRIHSASAPEGCTAGQTNAVLTLGKLDLTMMVLSWAQLGYILIQVDRHGRVLLHKRMDMGNERVALEQRCFQNLFGRRTVVDTSSLQYATQFQKVSRLSPNFQSMMHPGSGNPRLFRALAALIGLFGGISVGISLTAGAALQGFWVFWIAVLGLVAAWLMQAWAKSLFWYDKSALWVALAAAVVFGVLSILAGQTGIGLSVIFLELLAGLMAFYGGRRTESGRQQMAQILGLRRYMKTVTPEQLARIQHTDPDYFHSLAPYALAMGVDQAFAAGFGSEKLAACPYLTTGMDGHRTAKEWNDLLRQTVRSMNRRSKQMPLERLTEFVGVLKR